ncbi:MAG: DUF916 domain-containing protein [Pseudolysinimonas sp.]
MLVAVAMLALNPLSATALSVADGDDAAGVSLRPADETGAFDGRTNFRYAADPGQVVEDYAAVVNTGTETNEFTLIGTDAFNDENGDFALLATDEEPALLGRWVTFENGTNRMKVTLEPGEGRLVPFTLTLPADATPGDHVGGIVASVLGEEGQVQVDRRVAIRLYARVSGDLQPNLTISSMSASYDGDWWNLLSGTVTVKYTVTNPGNVALAANVDSGVNTWFGIPLTPQSGGGIKEILPGNSATYQLQSPSIGQWLYLNPFVHIAPFVDSADVESYTLAAPSSRDTVLFVMPWIFLIGLVVLAMVIALIVLRRRRENLRAVEWTERAEQRVREQVLEEANAGAGRANGSE